MSVSCGIEDEGFGLDILEGGQDPAVERPCGDSCMRKDGSASCQLDLTKQGHGEVVCKQIVGASREKLNGIFCNKCKEQLAKMVGNMKEPMCGACLKASLVGKMKTTINRHNLIVRHDRLLLGFSGSHSSRAALELLMCIQSTATTEAAALAERGRILFDLDVVFVDEAAILGKHGNQEIQLEEILAVVSSYEGVRLHVVKLQDIFDEEAEELGLEMKDESLRQYKEDIVVEIDAANSCNQLTKLQDLFSNIKDATGREDLLECFRRQLILRLAKAEGYSKVVLADSISRTAAKVLACVVKGQGYSMPGDIQYVDTRWQVPIIWPLRDCVIRELALFCHLESLETVFVPSLTTLKGARGATINSLTDSFVRKLQQDNMSRESTIVRTAHKLTPFPFNATETLPIPPSPWSKSCNQDTVRKAGEMKSRTCDSYAQSELSVPSSLQGGDESLSSNGVGILKAIDCCICGAPFSDAERVSFGTRISTLAGAQHNGLTELTNSVVEDGRIKTTYGEEKGGMTSDICSTFSAGSLVEIVSERRQLESDSNQASSKSFIEGCRDPGEKNGGVEFEGEIQKWDVLLPAASCQSCRVQILGMKGDRTGEANVTGLLPGIVVNRARDMVDWGVGARRTWAQNHIRDCLLDDDLDDFA